MDTSAHDEAGDKPAPSTTVPIPEGGWDFFISHAGADSTQAEGLRRELEAHGASAFEDSMLPAGSEWDRELVAHLAAAAVCVVLVSLRTADAHYQRSEYQTALELFRDDRQRRVVPVYLEPLRGVKRPLGLGILTRIDVGDDCNLADAAQRLVEELREARSLPAPGPRESAHEAAQLLRAIDVCCLRLDAPQVGEASLAALLERAVATAVKAGPVGGAPALRAALQTRGLDPRALLTASPDHARAVGAWLAVEDGKQEPLSASLDALRRALAELLLAPASSNDWQATEATRRHLQRLMTDSVAAQLPAATESFRTALEALLPPVRSGSRQAVLLDAARVATADEEPQRFSLTYVAEQMCRLPPSDPLLVGVEDAMGTQLQTLLAALPCSEPAVAWWSGTPGVGASTLGIEMARAAADAFPGGVRYIDLRGLDPAMRRTADEAARLLATSLRVGLPGRLTDDEQMALLRRELEGSELLLVLDNALDAEHVAPFMPIPSSCALIVTSRNRLQAYAGPGLAAHASPLERHASIELLARAACRPLEPADADTIARLCADVPLALRLAGAWMASRPELEPVHYARLLENTLTRLDFLAVGERAVRAAIDLSYQQLDGETRRLLRLVASAPGRTVTADELADALGEHAARVELLLQRLVDRNLAAQTPLRTRTLSAVLRYALPDLVHVFTAERVREEESAEAIVEFQRRCVASLARRLDDIVADQPDADLSLELDTHGLRDALRMAAEGCWLPEGLELAAGVEALAYGQIDISFMREVADRFITLQLAADRPDLGTLTALRLGEAMRRRARPALAAEAFRRAHELAAEHALVELEATACFHLSVLAADEERWDEALRIGDQAASTFERLNKPGRATQIALNNSKLALRADDIAAAAAWARRAWEQSRRTRQDELRAQAAYAFAGMAALDKQLSVAIDAYREASRLFAADDCWENAATATSCAVPLAVRARDDATMLDLAKLTVAHLRGRGRPSLLAAALVDLAAARFCVKDHAGAGQALAEAEQRLSPLGQSPLELLLDDVPLQLTYEVAVRRTALRAYTGERGLLTVARERRLLPALPDDPRVDPELEWVLEVVGAIETADRKAPHLRRLLGRLLGMTVKNWPRRGGFWLYDDLSAEPEPATALDA